jgi:hypothetical protein
MRCAIFLCISFYSSLSLSLSLSQRVCLNVNHKIIAQRNFRFTFKQTRYFYAFRFNLLSFTLD